MSENVTVEEAAKIKSWMSNEVYDALKFLAQIVLPALGTLYFALAAIWGLPYGEKVIGTITAVDVFIGVILQISTNQYNKSLDSVDGVMVVDTQDPNRDIYSLNVLMPFDEMKTRDRVTFKVNKSQ